ncbi:hypothetical protein AAG747_15275 [Rapidithrix thailandica]|uniref:Lipocalin-like domain-containing protein n=1 Tax=Rapidithrix thailandica TaxID=413964 RepID=A0AAW9RWT5_9BACT
MKNSSLSILASLMLFSCGITSNSNVFDSDKLRGKYKVIIDPDIFVDEEKNNLASGLAMLMLSAANADVSFSENNKCTYSYSLGSMGKTISFKYKIENDSLVYLKPEGKDWAGPIVIRKFDDSYDNIELYKEGEKAPFTLRKVSE